MANNEMLFREALKRRRANLSKRARERSKNPARGMRWLFPHAIERQYARELRKFLDFLSEFTMAQIVPQLEGWVNEMSRGDAFGDEFAVLMNLMEKQAQAALTGEELRRLTQTIAVIGLDVSAFNNAQFQKFIRAYIDAPWYTETARLNEVLQIWQDTNLDLIKSLPQEHIKNVNRVVREGVLQGKKWTDIRNEIELENKKITRNRANLIARDQIGKLNGLLTEERMSDAGISMYRWSTAKDERVRGRSGGRYPNAVPSHWAMEGLIGRWDNPTVYSDDGGKTWKNRSGKMPIVHPGTAIQCRCTAIPFMDEAIQEIDREIAEAA